MLEIAIPRLRAGADLGVGRDQAPPRCDDGGRLAEHRPRPQRARPGECYYKAKHNNQLEQTNKNNEST